MIISPIKTERILAGHSSLEDVIAGNIARLDEGSILAITSKIVSLCEKRVVPRDESDRSDLIKQESDFYTETIGKYKHAFSIAHNTLIPSAGIDESNGGGDYILWPENPQKTANAVRSFLRDHYCVQDVGVVITDSTCTPLRWGTTGISLAHSGFVALHDYVGQYDLFGRPFEVSKANIAGGLAAAAVVAMGEGAEQTPLCVIRDIPSVIFQRSDPTEAELDALNIPLEDDLFAPFLMSVEWHRGGMAEQK